MKHIATYFSIKKCFHFQSWQISQHRYRPTTLKTHKTHTPTTDNTPKQHLKEAHGVNRSRNRYTKNRRSITIFQSPKAFDGKYRDAAVERDVMVYADFTWL